MDTFEYISATPRVLFGSGTLEQLPSMLQTFKTKTVLILCTPQQVSTAETVQKIITDAGVAESAIFSKAAMHTPTHITDRAVLFAQENKVDGIVSVGGGSTVGLGKAISIRTGLPHLCIPTTYAGSEMTPILGETENGRKTTRRDPKILPTAVLYDVDLFATLPVGLTVFSGINAIAHAVEALYASNTNPVIQLFACEGIRVLCEALPALLQSSEASQQDLLPQKAAREKALYGAWLCGICLGSVDMALHHKLCHTLGGLFNLPHAETHVVLLPHAVAYNASAPAAAGAMAKLASVLPDAEGDAVRGINALYRRLRTSQLSLGGLRMPETGIDEACDAALGSNRYKNPRELERDGVRELIRRAWAGEQARRDL
ncbi:hypothetical protein B0H66DRAFT_524144 [Apodospora peruviana]|uniref:Maleylacetate reductase n=1 Tax=Apodospora peruviana TaxID=516989 RepID=A0AAE0HTN8_9PEZI|nr:hypothetical protein B0H66DRAFT_524144 [Apodospora peruviana]